MDNKKIKSNNEISELCSFSLGGFQQKVLIEGKSKDNPIVITLHVNLRTLKATVHTLSQVDIKRYGK